jgi:hypothetical protein
MANKFRVALIRDFNPSVIAHQAIPEALRLSTKNGHSVEVVSVCSHPVDFQRWIFSHCGRPASATSLSCSQSAGLKSVATTALPGYQDSAKLSVATIRLGGTISMYSPLNLISVPIHSIALYKTICATDSEINFANRHRPVFPGTEEPATQKFRLCPSIEDGRPDRFKASCHSDCSFAFGF